ncbi:unnamed protein product, partial [marine sediment metagenome]
MLHKKLIKLDDNAMIVKIGSLATIVICAMTFVTFLVTVGVLQPCFWESDLEGASIIGYDGQWGEDLVVV